MINLGRLFAILTLKLSRTAAEILNYGNDMDCETTF